MKVGIINTTFKDGSTGYLSSALFEYINQYYNCFFFYGVGEKQKQKNIIKVQNKIGLKVHNLLSRLFGLQGFFSTCSSRKIINIIRKEKIDSVILCNLHGNYINYNYLLNKLSLLKIKCVQIMWDDFTFTGKCTFSYECEKYKTKCCNCPLLHDYPNSWFFDFSNYILSKKIKRYGDLDVSFVGAPFTVQKAMESPVCYGKQVFPLNEAVDQNVFKPLEKDVQLMRSLNLNDDKFVILNVCPYPEKRKGGDYFIKLAKMFENDNKYAFVHVGVRPGKYQFPKNYIPVGYVSNKAELAKYYNLSDLFVCTSLAETQPDACLEALSCGVQICGFDVSGTPTCAPKPIGHYFNVGDLDSIANLIKKSFRKTSQTIQNVTNYSRPLFSLDFYCANILDIFNKL